MFASEMGTCNRSNGFRTSRTYTHKSPAIPFLSTSNFDIAKISATTTEVYQNPTKPIKNTRNVDHCQNPCNVSLCPLLFDRKAPLAIDFFGDFFAKQVGVLMFSCRLSQERNSFG